MLCSTVISVFSVVETYDTQTFKTLCIASCLSVFVVERKFEVRGSKFEVYCFNAAFHCDLRFLCG